MSIKVYDRYTPRANVADANYTNGSFKNESVPGANDGTPVEVDTINDYQGFTDALLVKAGVTASGNADTVVASDRMDALDVIFSRKFTSFQNMLTVSDAVVGDVYSTGATTWEVISVSGPMTLANFRVRGLVSVLDYEIDPTGLTDTTSNVQLAISNANTLVNSGRAGGFDFGGARLLISDTLNFTIPMVVEGRNASLYAETLNGDLIYVNAGGQTAGFLRNKWVFRDLTLAGGISCNAMHIDTVVASIFTNINIPFCNYGVVLENSLLSTFERVVVSGISVTPANPDTNWYTTPSHRNAKGFFLFGGVVTGPNLNTFIQCGVQNSTEEGIRCISGNNSHFIDFDSEGHAGNHVYADGCANLQFTGGDFEGTSQVIFLNCQGGGMSSAFVNNQVTISGTSNSVKINGGLIKIINITAPTVTNTSIDDMTLYVGASGIIDNGTNTHIGMVYDQNTSDPYFGNEWFKTGTAVVTVGGTTIGHSLTKNVATVKRIGETAIINIQVDWTALAGSGDVTFDISSLIVPTTPSINTILEAAELRVDVPVGYVTYYASITTDGIVRLKFKTGSIGNTDTAVQLSDVFGGTTKVVITGSITL